MQYDALDERVNVIILDASVRVGKTRPGRFIFRIQRKNGDVMHIAEIKRKVVNRKGDQFQTQYSIRTADKRYFVLIHYLNVHKNNVSQEWRLKYELAD
jgi:hypothetical protein